MKLVLLNKVSDMLRVLSFVAALFVVALHSNVDKCWDFVCGTLTRWAVPYFFAASGFFFAVGRYASWGQFYAKKVKSLLLPYLLWCLIACVIGTPLVVLNNYMTGIPLLERTAFESHSLWGTLDAMFGICRYSPKSMGVLWFVRSLIILFLLAPLWRFFSRASLAWVFVPVFCFLYFFTPRLNLGPIDLPIRISSFFFLGIVAAMYLPRKWLFSDSADGGEHLIGKSFSCVCMLSFWIYVTHNLFMGYLIAVGHTLCRHSLLPLSFTAPLGFLSATALSIASGHLIRRYIPRVFLILNGGRG